ncbi:hypothetical protein GCM10017567_09690 [Amycolatopsis bullii]|uniref:Uncharacterized protein n=1 Tax=Amycolatopsis bullii TaxID=941987 RepID=A0ABQ3JZR7_9PSEU|nr:hypothetical protein GCM10017567_09690 [Amycolatopsis bullii]
MQGGQRGDLCQREVVPDALCPQPTVEPDHRETQTARQRAFVRVAGHIVSIPYEYPADRVMLVIGTPDSTTAPVHQGPGPSLRDHQMQLGTVSVSLMMWLSGTNPHQPDGESAWV